MSYDRYNRFRGNGKISQIPYISIPKRSTDFYVTYRKGKSRLDLISYQYYGECDYDWLIMLANPSVASIEPEIPDRTKLRVPYPLGEVMEQYENDIKKYKEEYTL